MKCELCDKEAKKYAGISLVGWVCEECEEDAKKLREEIIEEYRNFDWEEVPDPLSLQDFERWALALAVQVLDKFSDDEKKRLAEANPFLLDVSDMALLFAREADRSPCVSRSDHLDRPNPIL